MKILVVYLLLSVFAGIITILRARNLERYMSTLPIGDVNYYEDTVSVIGMINWMFIPSFIVYGLYRLMCKIFK